MSMSEAEKPPSALVLGFFAILETGQIDNATRAAVKACEERMHYNVR